MAKPADAPEVQAPSRSDAGISMMSMLLSLVVVTGLSVGAGGIFGLQIASRTKPEPPPAKSDNKSTDATNGRYAPTAAMYPLPAIVTNLASPARTWIRFEASIVLDEGAADANALAAAIAEDTTAYLRTLSLPLIEGASGLLHLREDLNDRARIRSQGKVRDVVVHTLVVE